MREVDIRAVYGRKKLKEAIAEFVRKGMAAGRHGVSAHHARFLVLADQLRTRLVTEDVRLRAAAPALTQLLAEALSV